MHKPWKYENSWKQLKKTFFWKKKFNKLEEFPLKTQHSMDAVAIQAYPWNSCEYVYASLFSKAVKYQQIKAAVASVQNVFHTK